MKTKTYQEINSTIILLINKVHNLTIILINIVKIQDGIIVVNLIIELETIFSTKIKTIITIKTDLDQVISIEIIEIFNQEEEDLIIIIETVQITTIQDYLQVNKTIKFIT